MKSKTKNKILYLTFLNLGLISSLGLAVSIQPNSMNAEEKMDSIILTKIFIDFIDEKLILENNTIRDLKENKNDIFDKFKKNIFINGPFSYKYELPKEIILEENLKLNEEQGFFFIQVKDKFSDKNFWIRNKKLFLKYENHDFKITEKLKNQDLLLPEKEEIDIDEFKYLVNISSEKEKVIREFFDLPEKMGNLKWEIKNLYTSLDPEEPNTVILKYVFKEELLLATENDIDKKKTFISGDLTVKLSGFRVDNDERIFVKAINGFKKEKTKLDSILLTKESIEQIFTFQNDFYNISIKDETDSNKSVFANVKTGELFINIMMTNKKNSNSIEKIINITGFATDLDISPKGVLTNVYRSKEGVDISKRDFIFLLKRDDLNKEEKKEIVNKYFDLNLFKNSDDEYWEFVGILEDPTNAGRVILEYVVSKDYPIASIDEYDKKEKITTVSKQIYVSGFSRFISPKIIFSEINSFDRTKIEVNDLELSDEFIKNKFYFESETDNYIVDIAEGASEEKFFINEINGELILRLKITNKETNEIIYQLFRIQNFKKPSLDFIGLKNEIKLKDNQKISKENFWEIYFTNYSLPAEKKKEFIQKYFATESTNEENWNFKGLDYGDSLTLKYNLEKIFKVATLTNPTATRKRTSKEKSITLSGFINLITVSLKNSLNEDYKMSITASDLKTPSSITDVFNFNSIDGSLINFPSHLGEDNYFTNDEDGELFIKINIEKDGVKHDEWLRISGFKKWNLNELNNNPPFNSEEFVNTETTKEDYFNKINGITNNSYKKEEILKSISKSIAPYNSWNISSLKENDLLDNLKMEYTYQKIITTGNYIRKTRIKNLTSEAKTTIIKGFSYEVALQPKNTTIKSDIYPSQINNKNELLKYFDLITTNNENTVEIADNEKHYLIINDEQGKIWVKVKITESNGQIKIKQILIENLKLRTIPLLLDSNINDNSTYNNIDSFIEQLNTYSSIENKKSFITSNTNVSNLIDWTFDRIEKISGNETELRLFYNIINDTDYPTGTIDNPTQSRKFNATDMQIKISNFQYVISTFLPLTQISPGSLLNRQDGPYVNIKAISELGDDVNQSNWREKLKSKLSKVGIKGVGYASGDGNAERERNVENRFWFDLGLSDDELDLKIVNEDSPNPTSYYKGIHVKFKYDAKNGMLKARMIGSRAVKKDHPSVIGKNKDTVAYDDLPTSGKQYYVGKFIWN